MLCPLTVEGRLLGVLAVEHDVLAEWAHDEATAIRSVAEALAVALARDHDRRALVASEEQFRLIAEHAGDVITLLDADGICTYASTSARTVLGVDPEQLIGTDPLDHVHPDDRADAHERLASFVAGQDGAVAITYRWLRPSGDTVWIENVCRAVRDRDTGTLTGIQGSARDVTAHKIREDELTHRALHDPLTGVANRTLFDQRLAAALRAQRRAGTPVRRAGHRPRRVQGGQRRPRAPRGRPGPGRGGGPAGGQRAPGRHRGTGRRRRVHGAVP